MRPEGAVRDQSAALSVTRSFSGRRWSFRETDAEAARLLCREANVSPSVAHLLLSRSVSPGEVAGYLKPTLKPLLREPFTRRNMEAAVQRAALAVSRGETI